MKKVNGDDSEFDPDLIDEISKEAPKNSDEVAPLGTLDVVLGYGDPIELGGKVFNLAPFRFNDLPLAGRLAVRVPDVVMVSAVAAHQERVFDCGKTAELLNEAAARVVETADGSAAKTMTAEMVEASLGTIASYVTEDEVEAMTDLIHLAISRHDPGVEKEFVSDHLDISIVMRALVSIIDVNPGFADRV